MFGYVKPYVPELKVRQNELYKAVYCGLCKTMGKRVCNESRLTLSYDIVFLALVRFLLTEEKLEFVKGRCAVSPFKKKVILKSNPSLEYSAAVGALLTLGDENVGVEGVAVKIFLPLVSQCGVQRGKACTDKSHGFISFRLVFV